MTESLILVQATQHTKLLKMRDPTSTIDEEGSARRSRKKKKSWTRSMILQNMLRCRKRRRRKKETRRWRGQGAPYLQDVEGGQLHPLPLLRRVHLSPLENNRVRRKVDTPSQRGGRHKHLQRTKRVGGITKRKVTRRNKLPEETLHTVHTQPNLPMIH